MTLNYASLDDVRQGYWLRTHLESNFFPSLPEHAYSVASRAIKEWKNGNRSEKIQEILEALSLWEFV